jgi:peroxiredoxin
MILFKSKSKYLKWCFFLFAFVILTVSFVGSGNTGKPLPSKELKKLNGDVVNLDLIAKPAIISFWSTTCIPCIKELNAINEKYDSWKKEFGVEVYAVSTDDARFAARVPVIVNKKDWKFPVYTDHEKQLFKALNIVNNPYTIIVDKDGRIVYEHTSYKEGDEEDFVNVIKKM